MLMRPARQSGPACRPPRAASADQSLTEREVAVLRLLRGTFSVREMAQELFLSPNTVKTHALAIYRTLGVSNRHEAVARAATPASCSPPSGDC